MGIPIAPQRDQVEIPEMEGRRYGRGTVYYSRENRAFYSAGYEATHGPLSFDEVSGRLRWLVGRTGRVQFQDETGRFVSRGSVIVAFGAQHFRSTVNLTQEIILTDPHAISPTGDQQFVEYFYIRMPDGTVSIRTVEHGLGRGFSLERTGGQFFNKLAQSYEDPRWRDRIRRGQYTTRELFQFVLHHEVVLQTNLGPRLEPARQR